MNRADVPYAILTGFFGTVIFCAGRWSAPLPPPVERVVYREVTTACTVTPDLAAPPPPMPSVTPTVDVPIPVPSARPLVAVRAPAAVVSAPPKRVVPVEHIVLEETPEEPRNPYRP